MPVRTVSAALLELAPVADVPIVPIRFTGGLPVEPAPAKLDFPIGFGQLIQPYESAAAPVQQQPLYCAQKCAKNSIQRDLR
jgi:hypothetical protein